MLTSQNAYSAVSGSMTLKNLIGKSSKNNRNTGKAVDSAGYNPLGPMPEQPEPYNDPFAGSQIIMDNVANAYLARELQKIKELISTVPGYHQPIPKADPQMYRVSKFIPAIADVEIPKKFSAPHIKTYDGTTDPEEHVAQYLERMETVPIPIDLTEACLCKGFGATLSGAALKWLLNLPTGSITSFVHLVNQFNLQFSCSRLFEKITSDLYQVTQRNNESLKEFLNRFTKESLHIPKLDMNTVVQALKMGLSKDYLYYQDLVMTPCKSLDEARNRALRFIRLEEDELLRKRMKTPSTYDHPNRRTETPVFRPSKNKPYTRAVQQRTVEKPQNSQYPELYEFCLPVNVAGIVAAMKNLGDKAVRWPPKNPKSNANKDKSRWCAYHEDFGHTTEECFAFRREIGILLSKGYLTELFGKKKARDVEMKDLGGSEVCGTSYSAAKSNAKEAKSKKGDKPLPKSNVLRMDKVTFEEDDMDNIQDPHHDGLVITLYVANHFVRRILIDNGSSVNIIRLEPSKEWGSLKKKSAESRPWIHEMRAVPSTYHQCVKIPTPWEVVKIKGDQKDAKECYMASMKSTSKSTEA
uniref:uncharacterized protein LOC122604605 n=1 Tax=Erigeron canadensis TaxID=72917 RepID=UPI001CB8D684|nr:uncharacterized protein LOC122604605 [Erigeron canadensis]